MPAQSARSPKRAPGSATVRNTPKLPPITVAKFEETAYLLERVVEQTQAQFIDSGQAYKEQHRQGSSRPLTALEASQVATALGDETPEKLVAIQQSALTAYDDPALPEVLLAAGLRTAPAIVKAFRQVVALVEMPNDEFEQAMSDNLLPETIDEHAEDLRKLELGDARTRTSEAVAHYAKSAGFEPGEAWGLPVNAIWQALKQAASSLDTGSASSLLTGSAPPTTGPDAKSSTD